MGRYTPEDLYRIDWKNTSTHHLHQCPKDDICALLESWFEQTELRPTNTQSTLGAYQDLTKANILWRIMEIDWPQGLTMVQLSQVEAAEFFNEKRKRYWRAVRLVAHENQTIDFSIGVANVRQKLQDELGKIFKCYVYGMAKADENAIYYKVLMFDYRHWDITKASSAHLLHFYNTEYFLISCKQEIKSRYLEQSLVKVFGAHTMKKQLLTSKSLEALAKLIEHRKSLGVFNQFRHMQQDQMQNPLNFGRLSSATKNESNDENGDNGHNSDSNKDIDEQQKNQQATIASMSQLTSLQMDQHGKKVDFVGSREEKRRIIPIHADKMDQRFSNVEQVFGNYPLEKQDSLTIKLRQQVTSVLLDHGISIKDKGMDDHMIQNDSRNKDEDRMTKFFRDDEETDQETDTPFKNDDISESDYGEASNDGHDEGAANSIDDHGKFTFDTVVDTAPDDPYSLTIEINCNGTNVMAGLRDLAMHGFIEAPYPPWMMDLVSSGTSHAVITDTKMELISDSK